MSNRRGPTACPWCGKVPRIVQQTGHGLNLRATPGFEIWCESNECSVSPAGNFHETEAEAIAAWNLRNPSGQAR